MLSESRRDEPSLRTPVPGCVDDICSKYRQACQAMNSPPGIEPFLMESAPQNQCELRARLQMIAQEFRAVEESHVEPDA